MNLAPNYPSSELNMATFNANKKEKKDVPNTVNMVLDKEGNVLRGETLDNQVPNAAGAQEIRAGKIDSKQSILRLDNAKTVVENGGTHDDAINAPEDGDDMDVVEEDSF